MRVLYDKCHYISNAAAPGTALVPNILSGAIKRYTITVPYGRIVNYTDDTLVVKDDNDYLIFSTIVGCSGINTATNDTQVACSNIALRIYYTDA